MRNEIMQANQIHFTLYSFLLFSKSLPEVRKPWYNNHFSLYRNTFMCFMFKDIKAAFLNLPSPNPFRFLEASESSPRLLPHSLNPSKHLYQSSSSWEKIKQAQIHNKANCVPTQLDTYHLALHLLKQHQGQMELSRG